MTSTTTSHGLSEATREMTIALLACGINPEQAILYPQSSVRISFSSPSPLLFNKRFP